MAKAVGSPNLVVGSNSCPTIKFGRMAEKGTKLKGGQMSISSTLIAQIFCAKVLSTAFSSYVLALTNVQKHICT